MSKDASGVSRPSRPNGRLFLGGKTAFALWQALRCTACPRLDEGETMPQVLARLGAKPTRAVPFGGPPSDRNPWAAVACALEDTRRLVSKDPPPRHWKIRDALEVDGPPLLPILQPVDLLVESSASRRNSRNRRCRIWNHRLPDGAFVPLGQDVYLSRPEFVFLQLAVDLNDTELLLLGYEMCGFYAVRRRGIAHAERCRPLMTTGSLKRFLDRMAPGIHGLLRARRTVPRVLDRSASAAETAMVALLCTPRSHGGYGLPLPHMNPQVTIPAKLRELLGGHPLMCDAYWPDARFALEYDGKLDHEGADGRARDRNRISRLTAAGIVIETITWRELSNPWQFDKVARRVAHHIGYQLFSRDYGAAWHRKRSQLRAEVFGCLFGEDAAAL